MGKKKPTSKPSPESDNSYLKYYGLALEMVVLNGALVWGGYILDDWLTTSPILILAGTFLAISGTIWILMKRLK